jgi:hypothetical protein
VKNKDRQQPADTKNPQNAVSVHRIDHINIALMLVSCAAAVAAPFHTFLIAYAVLGPLHYLTEISWLHDRSYFAPRRWLIVAGMTTAVLLYGFVMKTAPVYEIGFVWFTFVTAGIAVFVRSAVNVVALSVVAAAVIASLARTPTYAIAAYFLVTIIHVFFFTAIFILFGAIKSRSRSALLSLAVMITCAVICFVPLPLAFGPGSHIRDLYAGFEQLNVQLGARNVYASQAGIAIMRVIAFAYLYHYLNWFSKTSVIRWHEVSRLRAAAIVTLWLGGVAVYAYGYRIGFAVFYVASMLHVLLEFPLNYRAFAGIVASVRTAPDRGASAERSASGVRSRRPLTTRGSSARPAGA